MPGKKKGSKKRKKSTGGRKSAASDGEDKVEGLENADPSTLMSGVNATTHDPAKKKGKKKKKKLSKSEKAHEKLEAAIFQLKEDEGYFSSFVERMHSWLVGVAPVATELYRKMDPDGEGAVTTEEFKAGLFDLKVPLTSLEVHLMTRLLDPDDAGEVDYTQLKQGLQLARENLILDKDAEYDSLVLEVTRTKFPPCPCCKMSIVPPFTEPYPRYISLDLRMVTFESFKDYPGHLDLMVHAHLPVCGLIQMIVDITQITSTKIAVFRDRSRSRESLLPPKSTLQDCGFVGDSRSDPEEVVLFYDYTVEFTDCPILLCDHYFGQKLHA
ncbi:hypothetical protein ACOMHN_045673 [Nucella lapillus]